jgi:hypothetical protein
LVSTGRKFTVKTPPPPRISRGGGGISSSVQQLKLTSQNQDFVERRCNLPSRRTFHA